jgi:hypothetical protein
MSGGESRREKPRPPPSRPFVASRVEPEVATPSHPVSSKTGRRPRCARNGTRSLGIPVKGKHHSQACWTSRPAQSPPGRADDDRNTRESEREMAREPAEGPVEGEKGRLGEPPNPSVVRILAGPSPQRERSPVLQFGWKPPRPVAGEVPRIPFSLSGVNYSGAVVRTPDPAGA